MREEFPERKIELVDTRAASLGEGIIVLKAAEMRVAGVSIETAAEKLRTLSARMCQIFTVDDLMYLRRGGRLSNLSAIVGTVLLCLCAPYRWSKSPVTGSFRVFSTLSRASKKLLYCLSRIIFI